MRTVLLLSPTSVLQVLLTIPWEIQDELRRQPEDRLHFISNPRSKRPKTILT